MGVNIDTWGDGVRWKKKYGNGNNKFRGFIGEKRVKNLKQRLEIDGKNDGNVEWILIEFNNN